MSRGEEIGGYWKGGTGWEDIHVYKVYVNKTSPYSTIGSTVVLTVIAIEHYSSETITDCTDSRTKVIIVTVWWHFIDIYMYMK